LLEVACWSGGLTYGPAGCGGADSSGSKVRLECKKRQQPGRVPSTPSRPKEQGRGAGRRPIPHSSTPRQGSCEKQAKRGQHPDGPAATILPSPSLRRSSFALCHFGSSQSNPLLLAAPTRTASERERCALSPPTLRIAGMISRRASRATRARSCDTVPFPMLRRRRPFVPRRRHVPPPIRTRTRTGAREPRLRSFDSTVEEVNRRVDHAARGGARDATRVLPTADFCRGTHGMMLGSGCCSGRRPSALAHLARAWPWRTADLRAAHVCHICTYLFATDGNRWCRDGPVRWQRRDVPLISNVGRRSDNGHNL
jgi:hypothetical protein